MAYGDFKDLRRRTVSDKVLRDIFLAIAKNSKYYACQSVLALVVCKSIENSATYTGREINFDLVFENQQLAQQLHKAIIKKL